MDFLRRIKTRLRYGYLYFSRFDEKDAYDLFLFILEILEFIGKISTTVRKNTVFFIVLDFLQVAEKKKRVHKSNSFSNSFIFGISAAATAAAGAFVLFFG